MTYTLTAHTVPAPAADHLVRAATRVLFTQAVITLGALTPRTQSSRMAQADATLVGAVALVTHRAVGLPLSLALTLTLKVDGNLECVFKAHRFDGESFGLLLWAAPGTYLNTERYL